MAKGDFHLHSTASDGVRSPRWVVDRAARNGVRVLALTDHDTTAGLSEAGRAAKRRGLRLVPGIELSTDLGRADVHLLGFGFNILDRKLQEYLAWMREGRLGRVEKMVAILRDMGAPIAIERVFAIAGDATVGRPHVARALIEAGHVESVQAAFDRFLHNGGPADVPRPKLTPEDAIAEVHRAGGVVCIAHPGFIGEEWEAAVRQLAGWGADGIETYYKHYPPELVARIADLGRELGLALSGGSDFHGLGNPDDREIGNIPFADAAVDALLEFIERNAYDAGERNP